jgi:hypothetical protein
MNTTKFMGSQSLNLANTAMKSLITLQNEIDGDFTPAGVLTASGGLVAPSTNSVITESSVLTSANSGQCFAIAPAAATTITIPTTPGFNANFVVTSASTSNTFQITTATANKMYGLKTIAGTTTNVNAVNNVIFAVKSTTVGQQIGDVINVRVIDSTKTLVTAISTGTSSITTS